MDWIDHKHQKTCFSQELCAALLLQEYSEEFLFAAWDVRDDWQLLSDWLTLFEVLESPEGAVIAGKNHFFQFFLQILPLRVLQKNLNWNQTNRAAG